MTAHVELEGRWAVVRQALRNPELRRVLAAYLLFNIAEWAIWIALLVWGFENGGVRGSSEIALAQLIPGALFAAPVSSFLTRFPRARALRIGYATQAIGFFAVGLALVADAEFVVVATAAAVGSVGISMTRPTHNALLPEISRTTADLAAGNAASGFLEALATFLGPLASGLILAAFGAEGVLLAMSACCATAMLLTTRLVKASVAPVVMSGVDDSSRPLRTVMQSPSARLLALLMTSSYVLVGMMDILLVVLALDVLGMSDAGPGILNSAIGVGGIAGAALTFTLVGRSRLALPMLLGAGVAGLGFAASGFATVPAIALVGIAFSGAGRLYYDVAARNLVQRLLPDHLLVAMFGVAESLSMTGLAVGTLAAPMLVVWLGPQSAFLAAGLFLPAITVASYGMLKRLDAETTTRPDEFALLMQVPIFAVLTPRVVERTACTAVAMEAPVGSVVVCEGEPGSLFYVIASGRVEVSIEGLHIRELGPGDWFGELALLRDVPRTATVTAVTPVNLLTVGRDSFLRSVGAVPSSLAIADSHIRDTYR